jgi:fatty acid desaturase
VNADLAALDNRPPGPIGRRLVGLLNDPRDLPFLRLCGGCALAVAAAIALLFADPWFWYLTPAYWAFWFLGYMDRFILMLHCTSHRQLFKREHQWGNYLVPWVLGPFFGETPESYFVHHMGMHHPENNLPDDLSSTMKYQRDRFTHWLRYFGTFITVGLLQLAAYHRKKGNRKLLGRLVLGEGAFWLAALGMAFVDLRWTLAILVGPVLFVRVLMMCGNWGQHAFVDAADPGNAYRNSITCINTRYNRRCFNDGYHILHHLKPRTHFTEYPAEFEENKAEYGRQDAIVFDGIDFFQVWLYLMLGLWGALARRFVRLPGAPGRTDDEVIAFLKSRLRPIAAVADLAPPEPAPAAG